MHINEIKENIYHYLGNLAHSILQYKEDIQLIKK